MRTGSSIEEDTVAVLLEAQEALLGVGPLRVGERIGIKSRRRFEHFDLVDGELDEGDVLAAGGALSAQVGLDGVLL